MIKKIMLVFITVVGSVFFAGCTFNNNDMNKTNPIQEIYRLPQGEIMNLAWVDEKTILIDIKDGNFPRIEALDIDTGELKSIRVTTDCKRPFSRSLQVLPNKRAGWLLDCWNISQIIQEIDLVNYITKDIYVEPSIKWVANFSYSHDMTELVLVDNRGLYMDSNLVFVDAMGERINITPDFQRADFPIWSPTEDAVAFLGTKLYPGSNDSKQNWGQIEDLLDYPWKLYLYNSLTGLIEELPVEIVGPSRMKWSPDGKFIAINGRFEGTPGLWLIGHLDNHEEITVTRIVEGITVFDFSRDSKSLVFSGFGFQGSQNNAPIYVIDVSALHLNP